MRARLSHRNLVSRRPPSRVCATAAPARAGRAARAPAAAAQPPPSAGAAAAYSVAPARPDLAVSRRGGAASGEPRDAAVRPRQPRQPQQQQLQEALQQVQHGVPGRQHHQPGAAAGAQLGGSTPAAQLQLRPRGGQARQGWDTDASGLWSLPTASKPVSYQDPDPAPPPVAPDDPAQLLQVLRAMPPPRRRLVVFKGGGYIYDDMEALIRDAGLGHVLRLTNLIRKAHCVVARPRREYGRRVNLAEHQAAAAKRGLPFLVIEALDATELVGLLRPLLLRKRLLVEARPPRPPPRG